jgi:branched-chain amino acid transport system permease protein
VNPSMYLLDLLVFVGIFGMMSVSLNLEFGFAGLANFGKVAFFLIGAYTYALLAELGIPFFVCLLGGSIMAAIFGFLISLPALRLRADYMAIVALTFGEILRLIVKTEDWIAGGDWGVGVAPAISIAGATPQLNIVVNIGLVYACLAICFIIAQLMANSPYGRAMRAIREDEVAAEAMGKNRAKYKAQIFMFGSAMAGLAGGLYAQYLHYVLPGMFMPMVTFTVWIMVLMGGPANNWGVLLGAFIVELFDRGANIAKDYLTLPTDPSNLQYILFGVLIMVVLLYRPQGLLKESAIKTKAIERVRGIRKIVRDRNE